MCTRLWTQNAQSHRPASTGTNPMCTNPGLRYFSRIPSTSWNQASATREDTLNKTRACVYGRKTPRAASQQAPMFLNIQCEIGQPDKKLNYSFLLDCFTAPPPPLNNVGAAAGSHKKNDPSQTFAATLFKGEGAGAAKRDCS